MKTRGPVYISACQVEILGGLWVLCLKGQRDEMYFEVSRHTGPV